MIQNNKNKIKDKLLQKNNQKQILTVYYANTILQLHFKYNQ